MGHEMLLVVLIILWISWRASHCRSAGPAATSDALKPAWVQLLPFSVAGCDQSGIILIWRLEWVRFSSCFCFYRLDVEAGARPPGRAAVRRFSWSCRQTDRHWTGPSWRVPPFRDIQTTLQKENWCKNLSLEEAGRPDCKHQDGYFCQNNFNVY